VALDFDLMSQEPADQAGKNEDEAQRQQVIHDDLPLLGRA
jgi:hypothetical protein